MTINVLLMILAFAIGPGTGQSIERSLPTTQTNQSGEELPCYINGIWYNPCPIDPPPDPPE